MATLRLNVRLAGSRSPIGLVAELRNVGNDGRSKVERTFKVLTAGEHMLTNLAPGTWEVRVLAPTGPAVSGDVELAPASDERLVLNVNGPRFPGTAQTTPSRLVVRDRPRPRPDEFLAKSSPRGDGYGGRVFGLAVDTPGLRATTLQLRENRPADDWGTVQRWRSLSRCVDGLVTPRTALAAREVRIAGRSLFGAPLNVRFDPSPIQDRRCFAIVEQAGRMRLHAVPVPFVQDAPENGVRLHARVERDSGLRSSIVLADPTYAGIVAYLASGAVVAAAELVGGDMAALARDALRGKRASPIGASAAAYVLVGSRNLEGDAPWHEWVANLSEWFPDIPDGAVLDARLRLLKARTQAQVDAVAPLLREAVTRGLPFYAVGIGWLMQSLRHFPDDPLLSDVLPWVEKVAAALDMEEAFTTLWVRSNL